MKRYYGVQLLIDVVLVVLGIIVYFNPILSSLNANMIFYTIMSIYAGLELIEFFSKEVSRESLCLFFASAVCAFSGFFLKDYDHSMVLSITLFTFVMMVSIIKIMSLERVYEKHNNLFLLKISLLSAFATLGILISINIYFSLSTICYMLALLYVGYGIFEFIGDISDYLIVNNILLKE